MDYQAAVRGECEPIPSDRPALGQRGLNIMDFAKRQGAEAEPGARPADSSRDHCVRDKILRS